MFGKECIFSFVFFLICVLRTVYMAYIFLVGVFVYLHGSIASKSQIMQLAMASYWCSYQRLFSFVKPTFNHLSKFLLYFTKTIVFKKIYSHKNQMNNANKTKSQIVNGKSGNRKFHIENQTKISLFWDECILNLIFHNRMEVLFFAFALAILAKNAKWPSFFFFQIKAGEGKMRITKVGLSQIAKSLECYKSNHIELFK
jgi:hypothetical protein